MIGTRPTTDRVMIRYAHHPTVLKLTRKKSRLITMHGIKVRWFAHARQLSEAQWLDEVTINSQEKRCKRVKGRKKCTWVTTGKQVEYP